MNKRYSLAYWIIAALALPTTAMAATPAAQRALERMVQGVRAKNYEINYININHMGVESLRYRHAIIRQRTYAQLLKLDGPQREVSQFDNNIIYYESGKHVVMLAAKRIVDGLPPIMYADFLKLSQYYDYISMGFARVADQRCHIFRIISRDDTRYSYIVWIELETQLPMRVDLLDRDGEVLEQFRVISFTVSDAIRDLLKNLQPVSASLPLPLEKSNLVKLTWLPSWLPAGVNLVSTNRRYLEGLGKTTESALYSDGLFSFAVHISPADKNSAKQTLRNGRRSIETVIREGHEITVVGEVPLATAKRIASSILFKQTPHDKSAR